MRVFEIILWVFFAIAFCLNLAFIPGGAYFIVVSTMTLAMLYMFLSAAILNGIRYRGMFTKTSYKEINRSHILVAVFAGIAFSITIQGILFTIQYWPGAFFRLLTGILLLLIVAIIVIIKHFKAPSSLDKRFFVRMIIIGGLAMIFLFVPRIFWVKIKYREHPRVIKAYEKVLEAPEYDKALWDSLMYEQERINLEQMEKERRERK